MISLYTYTNHVSIMFCFSFHCCIANGICFYWKSIFRILLKGIQVGSANSKSANANNNSPGLAQPIYTYSIKKTLDAAALIYTATLFPLGSQSLPQTTPEKMAVPLLSKKIVKKRLKKFKRPQSDRKISVKVSILPFFFLLNLHALFFLFEES